MNIDLKQKVSSSVSKDSESTFIPVHSVVWSSDGFLLSCSDDKTIQKWNSNNENTVLVDNLGCYSTSISATSKALNKSAEAFVVGCTDGTFRFISNSGREEKKVAAHTGSLLKAKFSRDGLSLLTSGEDGQVKVWSRNGNMRLSLFASTQPIYDMSWGPDDDQVVIATGKSLTIKSVQSSKKNVLWEAHSELILAVDWNAANNCIVSGGEDCKYCVWDSYGKSIFASRTYEHVITSVRFSPNGDYIAIGLFDTIILADRLGWMYCMTKTNTGSLLDISWSFDSAEFALASSNGQVCFATLIGRTYESSQYECNIIEPKKLHVQNIPKDYYEDLIFAKDRIVEVCLSNDWLIVGTCSQCYIYTTSNLNTPYIMELRSQPYLMTISSKNFCLVDIADGIQIVSFEGKVISQPKSQTIRPESLNRNAISISSTFLAVIDSVDNKIFRFFDSMSGKEITKITHTIEIVMLSVCEFPFGNQDAQSSVIVINDRNKDLHLVMVNTGTQRTSASFTFYRLASNISAFKLDPKTNTIVGLTDGKLMIWHHPAVAFLDKGLIASTITTLDVHDTSGRNFQIAAYDGNRIQLRKPDGSVSYSFIPPFFALLYSLCHDNMWTEAVQLCRNQNDNTLWGYLSALSLSRKNLSIFETSLNNLADVTKAEYVKYVSQIGSEEARQSELALLLGKSAESERILLQAQPPLIFRAIKLNLRLYKFDRALELATKYNKYIEVVVGYRNKYLKEFNKTETNKAFKNYEGKVTIDWVDIKATESAELNSGGDGGGRRNYNRDRGDRDHK